jgi:hypothetical protein
MTTGPYIEMSLGQRTPMQPKIERDEAGDEVLTWRLPLGNDGAVPHTSLDDLAHYARWLFDDPDRADGMDLKISVGHIGYDEMASAFTKVTGRKARFIDVSFEEYWKDEGYWGSVGGNPVGYLVSPEDPSNMTLRDDFTGWWTQYQHSGGNKGPCQRDYALLDKIHPGRIRSAEEFFRREDEKARKSGRGSLWDTVVNPKPVLKIHEDQRR